MSDDRRLAAEIEKLATEGGFNPFALLGGEMAFHSLFLAPFTPALRQAIASYLADGSGPLAATEEQLKAQGVEDPRAAARSLFQAAQGMCVLVLAGDHGVATVPQLFHGTLEDAWCRQMAAALGADFPGRDDLERALADLRGQAQAGGAWPRLVAGPSVPAERRDYWLDLGAATVAALDEGILPANRERLADLAHWCASAVDALGGELDGDDRAAQVRLRLLAGDIGGAGRDLVALAEAGADDALPDLLLAFVDGALRGRHEADAAAWLGVNLGRFDQAVGPVYDTAIALFRLRAAAGAPAGTLLEAAALLARRDRKAMRQDLVREPIWAVRPELAGELVDTAEAARLIERSPAFVSKRLEQGALPSTRDGERLRLPRGPLLAWKAVMDAHGLLA